MKSGRICTSICALQYHLLISLPDNLYFLNSQISLKHNHYHNWDLIEYPTWVSNKYANEDHFLWTEYMSLWGAVKPSIFWLCAHTDVGKMHFCWILPRAQAVSLICFQIYVAKVCTLTEQWYIMKKCLHKWHLCNVTDDAVTILLHA